jgi:hypothetical protein
MTREEKRKLRIQIQDLLDKCKGCKYISVVCASVYVCPNCPLGQQIQALGRKLDPKLAKRRKAKTTTTKKLKNLYTEEETLFVLENRDKLTYKEMAAILGRTAWSIRRRVQYLKEKEMISS